jgi:hypothetical protein
MDTNYHHEEPGQTAPMAFLFKNDSKVASEYPHQKNYGIEYEIC